MQATDQPIPHHPSAGGEIEQGVIFTDISMELELFGLLQQGAAGPVNNAFGLAGGA